MLIGAIAADPLGVLVAFGAGILSFLSPCVLPLVPGYLSMVSGLSAAELGAARSRTAPTDKPPPGPEPRSRVLAYSATAPALAAGGGKGAVVTQGGSALDTAGSPAVATAASVVATAGSVAATTGSAVGAAATTGSALDAAGSPAVARRPIKPLLRGILLFVAGFTVVFVALGAVASGVGQLLNGHKYALTVTAGVVVVVLGLVMVASAMPASVWMRLGSRVSGRVGWLLGERRVHMRPETLGAWAAPLMGMAFAFAWTPCLGPVLGAVMAMASFRSTLAGGVLLLFAYSLGLGVPFLVAGVAFDRLTGFYARARRRLALVQLVGGLVLVAFGVLLVAGDLSWLSAQFSTLLNDLGLHRLTTS